MYQKNEWKYSTNVPGVLIRIHVDNLCTVSSMSIRYIYYSTPLVGFRAPDHCNLRIVDAFVSFVLAF